MDENLVYADLVYTPGAQQPWRSVIRSGDNQEPLFVSSEAYHNKADAEHALDLVLGPQANVYRRESEHGNLALRLAKDFVPSDG